MSSTFNKLRVLGASAAIAAGFAMSPASAQTVSTTGTGSAVVIPYYTVNDGWETLVNVTNTSDKSLAVKFRMHESRNSRDVLDFNLALSPFDVWTATIRIKDGRPYLSTADNSCTSPDSVRTAGLAANEVAYSDAGAATFRDHDATKGSVERLRDGYITLLVMGEDDRVDDADTTLLASVGGIATATRGSTAYYAKHVNGQPRDCAQVDRDFQRAAGIPSFTANDAVNGTLIPGAAGSGNPLARAGWALPAGGLNGVAAGTPNPFGYGAVTADAQLKVNASLIKTSKGFGTSVPSLHITDYAVGANLVTAQQFPYFLEPTIASSDGLWTTTALAALEAGIAADSVANEWAENRTEPGVTSDAEWVVTFPTKRYHVDEDAENIQSACNQYRNLTSANGLANGAAGVAYAGFVPVAKLPAQPTALAAGVVCPLAPFTEKFQDGNDGVSNIDLTYTFYDREERSAVATPDVTVPSPFPPGVIDSDNLSFEANVVKIGPDARSKASVLGSPNALALSTSGLPGAETGWLRIDFTAAAYPVAGFMLKTRDFGDATVNFAQAAEHAYTR